MRILDSQNGLYELRVKSKLGIIDKEGNVVLQPKFHHIGLFNEGLTYVDELLNLEYEQHRRSLRKFIDTKGNEVFTLEQSFHKYDSAHFSDGLLNVKKISDKNRGNLGFLNDKGEIAIELLFDQSSDFSEGLAWVEKEGHYFYINPQGINAFPDLTIDICHSFSEGLGRVQTPINTEVRTGFINNKGNYIIKPTFNKASDFSNGLAAAVTPNFENVYIDKQGNVALNINKLFPKESIVRLYPFDSHYAEIRTTTNSFLINRSGKLVYGPYGFGYKGASNIPKTSEGLIPSSEGFINENGDIVIKNNNWDVGFTPPFFSDGLASTKSKVNGRYGYIDKKGEWVIEPCFDRASSFKKGLAYVELFKPGTSSVVEKRGYINKNGQIVWSTHENEYSFS